MRMELIMSDVGVAVYAAIGFILFLAHVVQGVIGFGSMMVALPLLSFFVPVKEMIPALLVVNLLQPAWFVCRERRRIDLARARFMLLFGFLGMPLGYAVFRLLPAEAMKLLIGFFLIAVCGLKLSGLETRWEVPKPLYALLNFLGGAAQGSMTQGGPFFVIYAAKTLPDKTEFRATLSLVWTVLNLLLVSAHAAAGGIHMDMAVLTLLAVPGVALGTYFGNILHDRIPEAPFRKLVFIILILSGLILLRPLFGI